jgi:predicted class III extradiol MEMO1 family dioxygenase
MVDKPDDNRKKIRESLVDGIFYPSEKDQLKSLILKLLDAEKKYLDESLQLFHLMHALNMQEILWQQLFRLQQKEK